MNPRNILFSSGDLAGTLNYQFNEVSAAVDRLDENSLLSVSENDICDSLQEKFLMEPVVLDRDGVITDSVEEDYVNIREFGRDIQVRQTAVTVSVPFSGDRDVFSLKPSTFTSSFPRAMVENGELKIRWTGRRRPIPPSFARVSMTSSTPSRSG